MRKLRQLKFTNKFKKLSSRLKWLFFSETQDYKLSSEYLDIICPDEKQSTKNSIENLQEMVEQGLIREFSADIKNSKSYEVLKDAIMYNLQKKSLK